MIGSKERRQSPRRTINRTAHFQAEGGLPRDCMVTDISERGARLYADVDVPERFVLTLTVDGKEISRDCRVVWRLGGELGVEFTNLPRR